MERFYTVERNVQMLISLMKSHGIRKIVASPGTTNICLIGSIQNDSYFQVYSAADERSAAYIACGMAAESGEPVALSCTGATASRNYIPGLTEAYYRKLPILAITGALHPGTVGSYSPQVLDRSAQLKDMVVCSVQARVPMSVDDEWELNVNLNRAMIALRKNGGGPVHINLMTIHSGDFSVKELPATRVIHHVGYGDKFPELKKGRTAVFVGSHNEWNNELTEVVDQFCRKYNAVVICDHTSNYKGHYKVLPALVCSQKTYDCSLRQIDCMIYIGCVTGGDIGMKPKEVWRINPDGEIRDVFRRTAYVFQMREEDFFRYYVSTADYGGDENLGCSEEIGNKSDVQESYLQQWEIVCQRMSEKIPELPFSNAWIAQQTAYKLPEKSVLHLGILNSLRCWNFFKIPEGVCAFSNVGGFGIDGNISSLFGASLENPNRIYFGIVGDLAFFYDMNVLGNRHFGSNVRLLLVNNGRGTEFRNYNHPAVRFGDDADAFIAAAGHYGNKSHNLVRHYAQDLGFEYMSATGKDEYLSHLDWFLVDSITEKPMLLEVFTDSVDESNAIQILYNLDVNIKGSAKKVVKGLIGEKGVAMVKGILKK